MHRRVSILKLMTFSDDLTFCDLESRKLKQIWRVQRVERLQQIKPHQKHFGQLSIEVSNYREHETYNLFCFI